MAQTLVLHYPEGIWSANLPETTVMRAAPILTLLLAAILAGCAALPESDRASAAKAGWPVLLPVEDILTAPAPAETDPPAALEARAARLRDRAAVLAATDI